MSRRDLILCFSGVPARTLFEKYDQTERALSLVPFTLTSRGLFDPATFPLWVQMQFPVISERDCWIICSKEMDKFVSSNCRTVQDFALSTRKVVCGAILRAKVRAAIFVAKGADIRLPILSKGLDMFYAVNFRNCFPPIEPFDVTVDQVNNWITNPDPRSYRACLDALALPAGAGVFVLDQRKKVAGGLAANLLTVYFDVTQPAANCAKALAMQGVTEQRALHA